METIGLNNAHDQIIAKIHALDLAPIKFKLMDAEEGYGWSREYADRIEIEYKRFLTLLVKYPDASIAPGKEVDKFWHGHILDTLKYADDCRNVFGYFLHHFPYFGMRGSEDAANLAAAAETMNRLYREEFDDLEQAGASSYCGVVAGESSRAESQGSSYCGATSASSYCGVATVKAAQTVGDQSSYCGAVGAVSYCGVVAGEARKSASRGGSYCGATSASSYCGVATGKAVQTTEGQFSYCGAVGAVSYCGVANVDDARNGNGMPRESVLKPTLRPTLPPSIAG